VRRLGSELLLGVAVAAIERNSLTASESEIGLHGTFVREGKLSDRKWATVAMRRQQASDLASCP